MAGYKIETEAYHRAEIQRNSEENAKRLSYDVEDVGLSFWGSDCMITFHHEAIRALRRGAENGFDGPATTAEILREKSSGRAIDAKLVSTRFGLKWCLSDAEARVIGKKWLSVSGKSLAKLGILSDAVLVRAFPYVRASGTVIGAPLHFAVLPLKEDIETILNGGVPCKGIPVIK